MSNGPLPSRYVHIPFFNPEGAFAEQGRAIFEGAQRDRNLQESLADRDYTRRTAMEDRQFGEQGRQFDARINVLRELLGRKMPDFYGGGAPAAAPAGVAATIGSAGGPPGNKRGFLPWGADQMSGAPVNNFLARFLGA